MTKKRRILIVNLLLVLMVLGMIEISSYVILHKIYNRSFDSSLIRDNQYFTSSGLKPNSSGKVWGKNFNVDYYGGRFNPNATGNKNKWLFIGDSVTEGVGVGDSSTFAALTQCPRQTEDVYNMSLIGYALGLKRPP